MKVIIYFGHHKVGSTALQTYLARNTLALLQHGILYPAVESQGMSHLLAQALGRQPAPDLSCMNLREPHNALGFRMLTVKNGGKTPPWHGPLPGLPAMLNTLRHQVEVLAPKVLVLCSEVFSNFGNGHEEMIDKLHQLFPQADYELYCALRRPDEYTISWHGQRLRFGHKMSPLSDYSDFASIHFDYRRMVAPWIKAFAGSQIHLRNYSDVLAAGGSVQDFTTQTSATFPKGLSTKGPSNHGLPRASYEILRQGNMQLPDEQAQSLRNIFLTAPKMLLPGDDKDIELFGEQKRAEMAEAFAPIHDYLSELTGQAAFFPDIEAMRQPRPLPIKEATKRVLSGLTGKSLHLLPQAEIAEFLRQLQQPL